MAVSIGPRIQVDGEPEYRQQINNIIEQGKTLDAEMRALTATFADNATEQEKATQSADLLNLQLDNARERTRLVREMTQKAAETTEENSTQTLKWRQALAAAEEQQAKLEHAVEENNRAIEDQGDAMEEAGGKTVGLGDGLDAIAGKLGIQIPDAAKEALNGVSGFSAATVAEFTGAAGAIGAAYEIGKKLFDLTKQAASEADALLTRSAQTGLDTSTLQGLDYASRFLDFEGIDTTLARFTQNMGKAEEGAKKQADAFHDLGIEIETEDGNLRNNWETFLEAIDALGEMENATERDTVANDLFGKSYTDLKPLIDAGTGALQSYIDEAEKAGYIIEEDVVKKLGMLDDALQQNDASTSAFKNQIAGELAPAFTLMVEGATAAQDGLRGLMENNSGLLTFLESTNPIGALVSNIISFSDAIIGLRTTQEETTAAVVESTVTMQEAGQQAAGAISEDLQALAENYNAAYEAALTSLEGQFGLWQQADEVSATSTETMLQGLQSQLDYWDTYAADFEALMSRNLEGIEDLASNFTDGSQESAAALAGLRDASDEEIQAVINKMAETDAAKQDMAARFAALETDLSGVLEGIAGKYTETVNSINTESGQVDFGPFEASVDQAFSFLESRSDAVIQTVRGQLAALSAEIDSVAARGASAAGPGYNAAGTESWRGGLTWVGESGPELVRLPRGSQIYSNGESQQLAGGVNIGTVVIEASKIRELNDMVRIFEGAQIEGRMM